MTALILSLAGAIGLQRLRELRRAEANRARLLAQGGRETGAGHYPWLVALHLGWLLGWPTEALWRGPAWGRWWGLWAVLFLAAQVLRAWAMASLGERWTTRIVILPGAPLVRRGPYRWLRHPNYLAVVVELAAAPLIFGAWWTAALASLVNAGLLLGLRLPAEEMALAEVRGRNGSTHGEER